MIRQNIMHGTVEDAYGRFSMERCHGSEKSSQPILPFRGPMEKIVGAQLADQTRSSESTAVGIVSRNNN